MSASTKKAKGAPSAPKKKPVSEEFVRSSDDESDKNQKPTEKRATPRKNVETKPARTTKPKQTPIPLPKSPVRPSKTVASQTQKESLAKQNNKSKSVISKKTDSPKKPNPKPVVEVPESSEESESSEGEHKNTGQINGTENSPSGDTTSVSEASDSESSNSEDDSGDVTDTSGMSIDQPANDKPAALAKSSDRTINDGDSESDSEDEAQIELEVEAREFVAPPGFVGVNIGQTKTDDSVRYLTGSKVAGKQIWHIIAPDSIPVEMISKISLEKVSKGIPVISHGGQEYSLSKESDKGRDTSILLPEESGYLPIRANLQGTLQLQQTVSLPAVSKTTSTTSKGLDNAASVQSNPPKPVRQQPKGLRMRFRMSGRAQNDGDSLEWSDSDQDINETGTLKSNCASASFKSLKKSQHSERAVEHKEASKPRKDKEGKKRKKEDQEGGKRKKKREA